MKFTFGKKQRVDDIDLDKLYMDLRAVLQKHQLVPPNNVDTLVSEWVNDILFVAGKMSEEELQEAMQTFEKQSVEAEEQVGAEEIEEGDDDEHDEDDE